MLGHRVGGSLVVLVGGDGFPDDVADTLPGGVGVPGHRQWRGLGGGEVVAEPEREHDVAQSVERTFLLDGKPFVIKAAEMHYMRIPRPYWEHRIQMAKALGMNAVCIYIFWNQHEQQEGVYDFETDERNVAEFVRLCQKNDMWVIVRPGPYVCAEWEMGGLPWWLLKHDDMKLRSLDKNFMTAVGRFERALAKQLEPFRLENGGNILMVQVENEYGSYAKDKPYVSAVRDSLRAAGWDKTQLFQCDWSSNFSSGQFGADMQVDLLNDGPVTICMDSKNKE